MVLNFEMEKLESELKRLKPKRVLVQLPEGIKQNAFEIKRKIEGMGIEAVFSGETCWGGCSISTQEAKDVGADLLVHFGHAQFIKSDFPILYIEVKDELDLKKILKKSLSFIKKYDTIGLSHSVQHKHDIDSVVKFYENAGKKIIISVKKGYAAYSGHVIGCEFGGLKSIADKVDAFVILGNNFHSMGACLAVEKPVILLDVYNDKVRSMEGVRDKIIRQRIVAIDKFKTASKVGVIIEAKPGQKFGSPSFVVDKLKKEGKEVILITMNELSPDKLMNFYDVDAFVELACPRIAIDDFARYSKPLITMKEALVAIGEKSMDDFLKEGVV
ncbi:MAG: diphthamide biosynthesis enzyme Dph2 [archaeon]|nr:diphthamide biosynthesis enzyme Dph2 [archaeon]MCR4324031.1 diphthamide biosynthesis enzyme Dph2 [Nanoarchaeota archaeon]